MPLKSDLSAQRRHFMVTLWPLDSQLSAETILEQCSEEIAGMPNVEYCVFQAEQGTSSDNIHIQLYIELNTSIRGRTLKRRFSEFWKPPHVEIRQSSRTACRDYCSKDDSRVPNTSPKFFGRFAAERKSLKRRSEHATCAELIKEGYSAEYIAWHYPHLFLKYGHKIVQTITHRQLYQNSQHFLPKAENYQEEE